MADWLITYGSWALAPFGLAGMIVTGRKKTWGWLLALTTQLLWALYALGTAQYGFLIGTTSYAAVYLDNYLRWQTGRGLMARLGRRAVPVPSASPELEALRLIYADMTEARAAGDEWASEWLGSLWADSVPAGVRLAAGDADAIEEVRA